MPAPAGAARGRDRRTSDCSIGATIDGDAAQRTSGLAAERRGEAQQRPARALAQAPRRPRRRPSARRAASRRGARRPLGERSRPSPRPRAAPARRDRAQARARDARVRGRAPAGAVASAAAVGAADPGRGDRRGGRPARGAAGSTAARTLLAGLAAVPIGTIEVTLREHLQRLSLARDDARAAARDRASLRGGAVVASITRVPRALNIGLLVLDVALFALLYKLLRARFRDAPPRAHGPPARR